ncbi:nitrate reductase cytochrome c-type subunit [Hahella sp. HN01]|uniref:nitrate reductase cytochrome c-type subunit n=1 Tax=Hahella sp. HN01 TaxID=2847262 RepID=UPI001C1EECBB|nr:nitrate reductase cytochrome c-type subunit [Hahella sp. HN01]MBU6955622.1 nitrate reductase cytochrome c-type subunit [Hahella sp. HN01]
MKKWLILLALPVVTALVWAENIATLRNAPLDENPEPPYIPQVLNEDIKRERAYPMQPPTIPHKIDNYQVDLNNNQCMHCHSRHRTEISQAPMVSVTHYMDREGNFLAEVSPRRYFCNQCHVPQTNAKPLVENNFKDIRQIIQDKRKEQ